MSCGRCSPPDVERDWGDWTADPETARLLNSLPRRISVAERAAYIARFDNRTSYLLGIFEKASDELVGIWSIYTDPVAREFLINVMVGSKAARQRGAWGETRDVVLPYFFENAGMESCRCTVVGNNIYMKNWLLVRNWVLEKTSFNKNPVDGSTVEIHRFRITRQAWRPEAARPAPSRAVGAN
jgi:RimJ/RimL family protein N-acetyltransferase